MDALNPAAMMPLSPEAGAAIEAATGCAVAELLAMPEPTWDVLARFAVPMLGRTEALPDIAWDLARSGVTPAEWAAAFRAAIAAEPETTDDE